MKYREKVKRRWHRMWMDPFFVSGLSIFSAGMMGFLAGVDAAEKRVAGQVPTTGLAVLMCVLAGSTTLFGIGAYRLWLLDKSDRDHGAAAK